MTTSPSCRAFRKGQLLELDGDDHAEQCDACRSWMAAELSIGAILRANAPRPTAPVILRERIAAALEAERVRDRRAPLRWRRRGLVLAASLALALIAVLGLIVLRDDDDAGHARAHATLDLIANDHLEFVARADRLQLQSSSAVELQRWFETHVGLSVRPPELRDAALVGGRRCNLGGRPVALAFYEHQGEPISLFAFETRGEDWSGMPEAQGLAGHRTCHHHERGIALLVWEESGLVFVLAAGLAQDDITRMLAP